MKRFYALYRDSVCVPFLCLSVCGVLFLGFQTRNAAAGTSGLQKKINRTCDRFVERIEAENGGKKCAVVVGSFFDARTRGKNKASARVEKQFFNAMLRRYSSHPNRPLFRLRYPAPLAKEAPSSGGYTLPAQARMLQKFGCGVLITGSVKGDGQHLSIHSELVDIISGAVIARSTAPAETPAGKEIPREEAPAPVVADSGQGEVAAAHQAAVDAPGDTIEETGLESSGPVLAATSEETSFSASKANAGAVTQAKAVAAAAGTDGIQEPAHLALQAVPDGSSGRQEATGLSASADSRKPKSVSGKAKDINQEMPAGKPAPSSPDGSQINHSTAVISRSLPAAPTEIQAEDTPARSSKSEQGVITGSNFRYEGEIRNGRRWGTGTLVFDNGDKYVGEWKNGMKDGFGTYYYANGDRYEGQWRNDRINGQGVYYYKSGSRYEGNFKAGRRDGKGIFYFSNGDRWEGRYRNGKKDGPAVYIWADGQSQPEEWRDGKQIR